MLLGTLGASLLQNLLTDKRFKRSKITERGVTRVGKGEGTNRVGQDF